MGRVQSVFARRWSRTSALDVRRFVVFFLVFALILAVLNVIGWRVQRGTRRALEEELGERLKAIAVAAAQPIDPDYLAELGSGEETLGELVVRDHFERLQRALAVANIVLVDRDGRTLVDLSRSVPRGETHPVVRLHPRAFASATSGIEATSELYASSGAYYKNGYAPVADENGRVAAVVAVESGARYFETLRRFAGASRLANGASAIAVLVLAVFLFRIVRAQARLDEALHRTETLAVMGEMAASVAHEIKNPLGIIRATAERLKKRYGTDDEIFDYIPGEVDRLTEIVNTYLDFARRGGRAGERGSTDVAEAVEAVLRLIGPDLSAVGVNVEAEAKPGLEVGVDASALRQVLVNLIVNARQAMPDGGRLQVQAVEDGARVRLVVADTGVGMTPEDLRHVFRPFYSGRERGTGLGLAITQRVVTEAGGSIEVASTLGKGTTFTVHLPRAPGAPEVRG